MKNSIIFKTTLLGENSLIEFFTCIVFFVSNFKT